MSSVDRVPIMNKATATLTDAETRPLGPLPDGHPPVASRKVGVLLVNLGTPDATDPRSMRRYLKEFLSDRRVIESPRAVWWPILYGIILNTRPKKFGKAYDNDLEPREQRELPADHHASQAEQLRRRARGPSGRRSSTGRCATAIRRSPSGSTRNEGTGCERILLFPLYPQYSAPTTATVNDKAFEALMKMRWQPAIRTVPPYHDDPAYIEALAASIEKHLAGLDFEPELVIASYHGMPQILFQEGRPLSLPLP